MTENAIEAASVRRPLQGIRLIPGRRHRPVWFASDNVFPSPDHVPYLHRLFEPVYFDERKTRLPWFPLPFFKMPYYLFVGKKGE